MRAIFCLGGHLCPIINKPCTERLPGLVWHCVIRGMKRILHAIHSLPRLTWDERGDDWLGETRLSARKWRVQTRQCRARVVSATIAQGRDPHTCAVLLPCTARLDYAPRIQQLRQVPGFGSVLTLTWSKCCGLPGHLRSTTPVVCCCRNHHGH